MSRSRIYLKLPSAWPAWLGALCIVLLLFSATVQVAHAHTDGRVHSDCALCHVAQKPVQSSGSQTLLHVVRPVALVVTAPQPLAGKRLFAFCLWNRPPPAGPVFS